MKHPLLASPSSQILALYNHSLAYACSVYGVDIFPGIIVTHYVAGTGCAAESCDSFIAAKGASLQLPDIQPTTVHAAV
jgi:hypothetical protein